MSGSINDIQRGVSTTPTGLDTTESRLLMTKRMERIVAMNRPVVVSQIAQFLTERYYGPARKPMSLMAYTPWRTEEERLIYLHYLLELELGGRLFMYGVPTITDAPRSEVIVAAMVEYEINRMKSIADNELPPPDLSEEAPSSLLSRLDTRGTGYEWDKLETETDRAEFEDYLLEIQLSKEEEESLRHQPMVYSGAATVNVYDQYIGGPFVSTVSQAKDSVPGLISLMMDFTPIVGQLKGVAEAIIGKDIITGRELADWERGLNFLLALLPSARGIFKAGKTGLRTLAGAAVKSGRSADEIYRVTKVASKLSEQEVLAAKQLVNGKPANPAEFEKVAGSLEEMMGAPKKGARANKYRVASGVIEDGRGLERSVASSPIDAARKQPGKVMKTVPPITPVVANQLTMAGIRLEAVAALEQAGIEITEDLAAALTNVSAGGFINIFYKSPGFELVLKDLVGQSSKKKGSLLIIEFVTDPANKINPNLVRFELPAGITKTAKKEFASRATDLVITESSRTLNFEFKAYNKASLALFAENPGKLLQLVKDVAMFGRKNIRWVFDSREVSRAYVYKQFSQAIKKDAFLAREFGDGAKLEKALDELIIMYPPVPKLLPAAIPLQGVNKTFSN